jgi:hypothetical protein
MKEPEVGKFYHLMKYHAADYIYKVLYVDKKFIVAQIVAVNRYAEADGCQIPDGVEKEEYLNRMKRINESWLGTKITMRREEIEPYDPQLSDQQHLFGIRLAHPEYTIIPDNLEYKL